MMVAHRHEPCEYVTSPGIDVLPSASHILVAEDHPDIQELLRWTLKLAGYHTMVCAGGQAAFTWVDGAMQSSNCPALILIDLSFPDTNATDFLHHLRARCYTSCGVLPQIIVLTTSKKVQEDLAPLEHVVLKPFHIQDLLTLIQQVIPGASPSGTAHPGEKGSIRMHDTGTTGERLSASHKRCAPHTCQ